MAARLGNPKTSTSTKPKASAKRESRWTPGISDQVKKGQLLDNAAPFPIKNVLVSDIATDPNQPRKLSVTKDLVTEIAKKHPIDDARLLNEESDDWLDEFIDTVAGDFSLEGKALGDFKSIMELAVNIQSADRLLNPLTVRLTNSGLVLIAGERRLLALVLLGEAVAPVHIKKLDNKEVTPLQWSENMDREDMTLAERVGCVEKLIEESFGSPTQASVNKVSKVIGRGRSDAQRYLAVLRCPHAQLREAIDNGKVTMLQKAATLAQLNEEQLEQALNGTVTKPEPKTRFRVSVACEKDQASVRRIVEAAASSLGLDELIKGYNLARPGDLTLALSEMTNHLSENEET